MEWQDAIEYLIQQDPKILPQNRTTFSDFFGKDKFTKEDLNNSTVHVVITLYDFYKDNEK